MDLATGGENRPMWPGHIGMPNPGVERLVRLADSARISQPQQYFSLTRNQPAIQPTVFSSHVKSASQPASQPNRPLV